MARNVAIGDIHGKPFWKDVLEKDYDNIYVTGDYWDSFTIPFKKQKQNFIEIIKAAREDSRLHLCIGNHDLHYIVDSEFYSGFQDEHCDEIKELVESAMDVLRVAFTAQSWVVSHAGFSKTFMRQCGCDDLEQVEKRFRENYRFLGFAPDGRDPYGNDRQQGPLWIRPNALLGGMFFPYQIVGHTELKLVQEIPVDERSLLVLVDTQDAEKVYEFS
jgi:hypothetical protein